jgi:ribosomal protein S18 acetylase RimI-like enzyme
MGGYVPKHILLFVSVLPETRGRGIGGKLIKRSIAECEGDVKLHVEYENPAKRLYERLGFTSDYAEMRFKNS